MTKYLVSAALAGLIAAAAFTTPAAAQVSLGVDVGPGRSYSDDRYSGDRYYGDRRGPGGTVYSGRSSYRDDCRNRRTTRWVNGRKVVRTVRVCD